ncbi:hypothetical protein Tco_0605555 [Tanacetum coccineum]
MQGMSLTKQEQECKLYDEFDKFTYKKGESLHEYYLRFTLLLNDMNIYKMPLEQFQVNTKFLNTLPDEWSKFVTDVKLVKDLHTTNVDQLHAYLEQHERHANEVLFQKGDDPIDAINHMMLFFTAVVTSRYPTTNNQLRNSSNPRQQATINNGRVTLQPIQGRQTSFCCGSLVLTVHQNQRERDDLWFKEKVLLVQAQAHGQILNEEELAFLADPDIPEDALAEVHNHDNMNNNAVNQAVQVMSSSQQSNVVNHSETEITISLAIETKSICGDIIVQTNPIVKPDSEETIALTEKSRSKMLLKHKDNMMLQKENQVESTPTDYATLNQLYKDFSTRSVPQTELSAESLLVSDSEKSLAIRALKDELRKLKGKALVDNNVLNHPCNPELHQVNVEPITPKLLNKRTAHSTYIKNSQEEATVLRDLVDHIKANYTLYPLLESAYHLVELKGTAPLQHSKLNANFDLKCVKCTGCMLSDNHDLCVLDFINNVNARALLDLPTGRTFTIVGNACPLTRITTTTEVPLRKSSALDNKTPKPVVTLVYSRKPKKSKTSVPVNNYKVIQIILWYLDSSCSKHMTGDRSHLTNFVNKFLGIIKFGNDHVAKIMGYGYYQIRNVTISRVYYVEGLGHNLFYVGQFCDSNLEVAFCQHTCYIRNLEGVDLLTGSRGDNLYTLSLRDMMAFSPICLLSKASKTKSCVLRISGLYTLRLLDAKVEAILRSAWTEKDQIDNFLKEKRVNSFTMKMEILLEPTSNKLMVEHDEFDESKTHVLERFCTSAGNHVKEILLKLNLPDHRKLKDGGEVKELQRSFHHSDIEFLSQSDEVLKLKNFKKDATLKLSKSTNQEWYEHVGPEVTRLQDDKVTRWRKEIMHG